MTRYENPYHSLTYEQLTQHPEAVRAHLRHADLLAAAQQRSRQRQARAHTRRRADVPGLRALLAAVVHRRTASAGPANAVPASAMAPNAAPGSAMPTNAAPARPAPELIGAR